MNHQPTTPSNSGRSELHVLSACPLCQTAYHPLTTRIVAERDDAHLFYLECRQCGSAVVAIVTTGSAGVSSVGALTDLTSAEVLTASIDRVVTTDDVVDLYDWLESQPSIQLTLRREKANT